MDEDPLDIGLIGVVETGVNEGEVLTGGTRVLMLVMTGGTKVLCRTGGVNEYVETGNT